MTATGSMAIHGHQHNESGGMESQEATLPAIFTLQIAGTIQIGLEQELLTAQPELQRLLVYRHLTLA